MVGTHTHYVKGYLSTSTSIYQIQSFTVTIIDPCASSSLTASGMNDYTFVKSTSLESITFDAFTETLGGSCN